MRYLMTFSYDGSRYIGYQKQVNDLTIQTIIEKVLTKINSNVQVNLSSSGRTDKGVHALNQKGHFDLNKDYDLVKLKYSINKMLPNDIYIKDLIKVANDFHARFDVKEKTYIYKINIGEYNPIEVNYVYQYNNYLDVDKMSKAIKYFEGEHNFLSFTKKSPVVTNYERTIFNTNITKNGNIIEISFTGNGFLRYMVRNMVGLLLEIGNGKKDIDEVSKLLKIQNREFAGINAPANGLYLYDVKY